MSQCIFDDPSWTHVRPCAETPGRTPCFRCREKTVEHGKVTVAEPKHATAMAAEMARVTMRDIAANLDKYTRFAGQSLLTLPTRAHYLGPCECGRPIYGTAMDHGRRCEVCRETDPKPPTLREWLGDRVSELGPWAEVLREHPVPAGWIVRWEWASYGGLNAIDADGGINCVCPETVFSALLRNWNVGRAEAYLMACFTRHPAVKPEPRKPTLRTWFGNEEEP